jgi:drug/metabolite transporter (DMT)-like permease
MEVVVTEERRSKLGYLYIVIMVVLTVFGQLVFKWQINNVGAFPEPMGEKLFSIGRLLLNPWIILGFASAFLASIFWIGALNEFELSYAYPFTSLSFVLVLIFSGLLLGETITWYKIGGVLLICLGILVASQK